jgi:hypothetical protein
MREALRHWPTNPGYLRYYVMTFLSPGMLGRLKSAYNRSNAYNACEVAAESEAARWHSTGN